MVKHATPYIYIFHTWERFRSPGKNFLKQWLNKNKSLSSEKQRHQYILTAYSWHRVPEFTLYELQCQAGLSYTGASQ